ncbi:unnamed protein product, partial [Staurois parvus]
SPVPCDLCDHSQISHVVSKDGRSDILLTPIHVITDWPISDHIIGSHRAISVPLCPPDRGAACSQGTRTVQNGVRRTPR